MAADCATAVKCNSELATREIDVVFLTHPHAWKRSTGVVAACSEKQVSGGSGTGAYLITSVTHAADSDKKNAVQVQYDESDLEFIRR
jgi:hypothetical protein